MIYFIKLIKQDKNTTNDHRARMESCNQLLYRRIRLRSGLILLIANRSYEDPLLKADLMDPVLVNASWWLICAIED